MISRSASPVLALSGLSLVAVIWLGLRLGLSHNSSRIRKNKASDVPGSTPPAVKPRKFSKKHVSTSPDLKDQVGVSVSEELERAINECKEMVEIISNDCRATNKKFRDIEFDLGSDPNCTFYGLVDIKDPNLVHAPAVKRVTDLFDHPKFFSDRPGEHDIHQGRVGDCWFLSSLSTVAATSKKMIERVCVARDEEVGVYGFVFQRNGRWVSVIIDDQLFWTLPKFEELTPAEKELYHNEKELYQSLTRNTGQSLYHAHSGLQGETWVPLIEKAFAKLHGDFSSLNGGWISEGVEDLTGGVSVILNTADILDPDVFWTSELLPANPPSPSRLIGVSFLTNSLTDMVEGLVNNHAYSVLRARECRGRRFVVLRNPWGSKEWTGSWSDGSKLWTEGLGKNDETKQTENWTEVLKELDHTLGDDGEFVMEYDDFLATWHRIEITTLPDSSWVVSSHWLRVPPQRPIHPWAYGDVSFSFTLSYPSQVHVVLSQLDDRYFRALNGLSMWGFDFILYKRGDTVEEWECQGSSYCGLMLSYRSVCWLGELQEGEYIVWPRLDRWDFHTSGNFEESEKKWDPRKLGRILMNRTAARAVASNYDSLAKKRYIPKTASDVIAENKILDATEDDTPPATSASVTGDDEDERCLWLGLKVYTRKDGDESHRKEPVVIEGWVKDDEDLNA